MHRALQAASVTGIVLLIGCGSVASATDAGLAVDAAPADAELICATGSRACAGDCVDNTSPVWAFDDRACGVLGATCLRGTTCQNGACVAAAANGILRSGFTSSKPVGPELIAAAGALYWSGSAGFSGGCMPADGGCAEGGPLAGYFGGSLRLVATNGGNFLYYYYSDGANADEVWVLDRTSTASRRLVDNAGIPGGLAVDASGNLFFTTAAGQVLVVAGGTAPPAALISSGPTNAQKIVIVGSTLYYTAWGSAGTTGEVRAVPIGGAGAFTTLAAGQAKPTYLAVVGERVFWTNQGDGTVWSQNIATPTAEPIQIAREQSTPLGIAADASAVYWINQGSGTVMKALRCGGGTIELANGQSGATEIVILGGHLYWTAVGANQLVTIPE
jgi:hypothetical protein